MIVGFGFTKIHAEKIEGVKGKIEINNNVLIRNVEESDLSLGNEKQKALKFIFEFTSSFSFCGVLRQDSLTIFLCSVSTVTKLNWSQFSNTIFLYFKPA